MLDGTTGTLLAGDLTAVSTDGGPHSAATWAKMATRKIVSVSDNAPQPIRDQAHAFAARVENLVTYYIGEAHADVLAHTAARLEKAGMRDAAEFVRMRGVR